jgi:hypothetical protein
VRPIRSPLPCLCVCLTLGLPALSDAAGPPPATPRFAEETESAGLQSRFEGDEEYIVGGGVAAFDCDSDGLPDLYVTAGVGKARFYRNRSPRGQALKLQEYRSGLETTNAIGAYPLDIDSDGNLDLVVLRVGEVQVFRGLGQCRFEPANEAWGLRTGNGWHTAMTATWERGQRWPTLAIGTYTDRSKPDFPWGSCTPALLMRPRPEGGYLPATPLLPGHCALSMLFSDWNRSGTASLRVSNDREYYKGGEEQLWRVPAGAEPVRYGPADGWKPLQIWGMGIASHDLTGDGYPELFLTSMSDNAADAGSRATAALPTPRSGARHRPPTYVGGDVDRRPWRSSPTQQRRSDRPVCGQGNVSCRTCGSADNPAAAGPDNGCRAGHTAGRPACCAGAVAR